MVKQKYFEIFAAFTIKHRKMVDNGREQATKRHREDGGNFNNFVVHGGDFMKRYLKWVVETYQPLGTCENYYSREMIASQNHKCRDRINRNNSLEELLKITASVKESTKALTFDHCFALNTDHWISVGKNLLLL